MSFNQAISALNENRRRIIFEFHGLKAQHPDRKKIALIRETATKIGYKLDKTKNSSSYVMKVVREWEHIR